MRLIKNNSGQSLVEVLLAVALTGLLLGALVIATTRSIRNSRFAQDQAKATHLAQEKVEYLRNMRDEQGWEYLKDHLSSCPGSVPSGFSCAISQDFTSDDEVAFTVVVSWEGYDVRQKTTLTKWAY